MRENGKSVPGFLKKAFFPRRSVEASAGHHFGAAAMAKDDKSKKPVKKGPKDTDQADLEAMEEALEEDIVVVEDDAVEHTDEVQVVEEDVVVVAEEEDAPGKPRKPASKATMLAKAHTDEQTPA